MKKLFFLAAAVLASFSLFAETEGNPTAATKNTDVVCKSYTIAGTSIPGGFAKGTKDGDADELQYLKLRTANNEKENTLVMKVNAGCKITGISMRAFSNNKTAKIKLSGVAYDDVAEASFTPVEFPGTAANTTATYKKDACEAKKSITFTFDNSEVDASSTDNKNNQIAVILTITYEITATTYTVTYKANYGEVADVVDDKALTIAANPFAFPENQYFVGWNTAADGKGTAVAVGSDATADVTLYAQWKTFKAGASLNIAAEGDTPAKDGEVALEAGSNVGKLYFAGAVSDYTESFVYKESGLQMSKGGADSLRLELTKALAAGDVIQIMLVAVNDGAPAINLVSGGKTVNLASNVNVTGKDTVYVYYTVAAEDGFAASKKILIQRGASSVILGALAIEYGESGAPEEKSTDASIKSMEINKTAVTEKDGVFAYEVAADENLAKVKVEFVLADKATADKTSPLEIDVPAAGAAAKEETINVTAEDGVTKKAYKISITKAKKTEALEDVADGQKIMKSFENGQLVIIKNGVKYNAAGAVVR